MNLNNKLNMVSTNINIMRFVAALIVIIGHSFSLTGHPSDLLEIFSNQQISMGGFSVGIFFFLSGLYVSKSLEKSSDYFTFMKKRCIRIFPQLWIVIGATVFLLGPLMTDLSYSEYLMNKQTWLYLFNCILKPTHVLPGVFTNNIWGNTVNGALWTLPVEFALYIMLVLIVIFSSKYKNKTKAERFMHLLGFFLALIAVVYADYYLKNAFLVRVFRPVVLFLVGTLYFDYAKFIKVDIKIALVALLLLIISFRLPVANILYCILLPYVIVGFGLCDKQIKYNGILGKISYEMYLVGAVIQQTLISLNGGEMKQSVNACVSIIIDIFIAIILYKLVEYIENGKRRKKA